MEGAREKEWNEHLPYAAALSAAAPDRLQHLRSGLLKSLECKEVGLINNYAAALIGILEQKQAVPGEMRAELLFALLRFLQQPDNDLKAVKSVAHTIQRVLDCHKRDWEGHRPTLQWTDLRRLLQKVASGLLADGEYVGATLQAALMQQLLGAVRAMRPYFAEEAEQQVVRYFLPKLAYPASNEAIRAATFVSVLVEGRCVEEWRPLLRPIWPTVANDDGWNKQFMSLWGRAAKKQIGRVDWSGDVDFVFSVALSKMGVSLASSRGAPKLSRRKVAHDVASLVPTSSFHASFIKWVAYGLNGSDDDPMLAAFKRFVATIEPYSHPSNGGAWGGKVAALLGIGKHLVRRLRKDGEREGEAKQHALTADIVREVAVALLPTMMQALFSKEQSVSTASKNCFKHLGYVCPKIVLSPLLERTYFALETVTETHQAAAVLRALRSVLHPLLSQGDSFPEGATHLVELLKLTVPSINGNDPGKTDEIFRFYLAVLLHVPLQDDSGSAAGSGASEVDGQVKASTAQFSDWVALLFDRLFYYFGTLSEESNKRPETANREYMMRQFRASVFQMMCDLLFSQMSPAILKFALQKMADKLAEERYYAAVVEVQTMVEAAVKVGGNDALRVLLPVITQGVVKEHKWASPSKTTATWCMKLMQAATRSAGSAILKHATLLQAMVDGALDEEERSVRRRGIELLQAALRGLTQLYVVEYRSRNPEEWQAKSEAGAQWQGWGEWYNKDTLDASASWHVPSDEEVSLAADLVHKYLPRATAALDTATNEKSVFTGLRLYRAVLKGVATSLPQPDEAEIPSTGREGLPPFYQWNTIATTVRSEPRFAHVRGEIGKQLLQLHAKLSQSAPDALASFKRLLKTLRALLHVDAEQASLYPVDVYVYNAWYSMLENQTAASRPRPRALLLWRARIQHAMHHFEALENAKDTEHNRKLLRVVQDLALHEYAAVRKAAQSLLSNMLGIMPRAYCAGLPRFIDIVSDPQAKEHEVTGSLYLLMSAAALSQIVRKWHLRARFLHAMARAYRFEKATTQARITKLFMNFMARAYPAPVRQTVAEDADALSEEEKKLLQQRMERNGKENEGRLRETVADLVRLVEEKADLHWRYKLMVYSALALNIRRGYETPAAVGTIFARGLLSDSTLLRKLSVSCTQLLLSLERSVKRARQMVPMDGSSFDVEANAAPLSGTEWDAADLFDRGHEGFSAHPGLHKRYGERRAASDDERSVAVAAIAKVLAKEGAMQQLLHFFSQDHSLKKGEESLSSNRAGTIAQLASRHLGIRVDASQVSAFLGDASGASDASSLIGHIGRAPRSWPYTPWSAALDAFKLANAHFVRVLVREVPSLWKPLQGAVLALCDDLQNREAQCTIAEVLGGAVRAAKHWTWEQSQEVWRFARKILSRVLPSMPHDVEGDWVTFVGYVVYNRDVRRVHWLLDELLGALLQGDSSTQQARSLNLLKPLFYELGWRATPIWEQRVLPVLARSLSHRYKQVRLAVAQALLRVYSIPTCTTDAFRSVLDDVLSRLQQDVGNDEETGVSKEKAERSRFRDTCNTFLGLATKALVGTKNTLYAEKQPHLLVASFNIHKDADLEVQKSGKASTFIMAQFPYFTAQQKAHLLTLLRQLRDVTAKQTSWHTRRTVLPVVQLLAFNHRFVLTAEEKAELVHAIYEELLVDRQVEIRELAALALRSSLTGEKDVETISGWLAKFEKWTSVRLRRKRRKREEEREVEDGQAEKRAANLAKRHAGVLGYCAVVLASPYDIPPWLPKTIVALADHVNDPYPIGASVKTTVQEFWRTHKDAWDNIHRHKFEGDDLYTVQDMVVSPNYYA